MLHAAEVVFGFTFVEDSPDYAAWKTKTQVLHAFWTDVARPNAQFVEDVFNAAVADAFGLQYQSWVTVA